MNGSIKQFIRLIFGRPTFLKPPTKWWQTLFLRPKHKKGLLCLCSSMIWNNLSLILEMERSLFSPMLAVSLQALHHQLSSNIFSFKSAKWLLGELPLPNSPPVNSQKEGASIDGFYSDSCVVTWFWCVFVCVFVLHIQSTVCVCVWWCEMETVPECHYNTYKQWFRKQYMLWKQTFWDVLISYELMTCWQCCFLKYFVEFVLSTSKS